MEGRNKEVGAEAVESFADGEGGGAPLKTFMAMNLTILEEYGKELGEAGAPQGAKVQGIATMLEDGADLGIEIEFMRP